MPSIVRSRRYSVASRIWVQPPPDLRRAFDRLAVSRDQPFRAEPDDPVDRVDIGDGAAVLVAPRRVEVGDVAEQSGRRGCR